MTSLRVPWDNVVKGSTKMFVIIEKIVLFGKNITKKIGVELMELNSLGFRETQTIF